MLSNIVLRLILIIGSQCTGLELTSNLRGIVCLESSPNDYRLDQTCSSKKLSLKSTSCPANDLSSLCTQGRPENYASRVPVTVLFGNDKVRDQHIREAFGWLPQFTMAFTPLDDKVGDRSIMLSICH